jgi:hypothetical protein
MYKYIFFYSSVKPDDDLLGRNMLLKIIEKIVLFDWTDRNSNIFYLNKISFNSPGDCRIPLFEEKKVHKSFLT